MQDVADLARRAATQLWGMRDDCCIETASGLLCDFIVSAAAVTEANPAIARAIGVGMQQQAVLNGRPYDLISPEPQRRE